MWAHAGPKTAYFTHVGWGAFVNRGARHALTNTTTAAGSAGSAGSAAGSSGWGPTGRSFYQLTNLTNASATSGNGQSSTDDDDNRIQRPSSRLKRSRSHFRSTSDLHGSRKRSQSMAAAGHTPGPVISLSTPVVQEHLRRAFSTAAVSASTPTTPVAHTADLPAASLPAPRPRRHSTSSIVTERPSAVHLRSSTPPPRLLREDDEANEITTTIAAELDRLADLSPSIARQQIHRLVLAYREQPHISVEAHAAAFRALLHVRPAGAPLRPAFSFFDEMPARNLRWSSATVELAIQMLMKREREIQEHVACLEGRRNGATVPSWLTPQASEHLWTDRATLLEGRLAKEIEELRAEAPFARALDLYLAHWRGLDTVTANILLAECAGQGKSNAEARMDVVAERIMSCLERSTIAKPSTMTYVHLVEVHRARGDKAAVLKAFDTFETAKREGALETVKAADTILGPCHIGSTSISAPVKMGHQLPPHLDTAEQLLYAGVIGTLFDVDEPAEGLAWLERMLTDEQGLTAGANALLEVIVGFAKREGEVETARTWLARVAATERPNELIYLAIANAVLETLSTTSMVDDFNNVLVDVSEVARENGFKYDAGRWMPALLSANLAAFDRTQSGEERQQRLMVLDELRERLVQDQGEGRTIGTEATLVTPALSLRLVRALASVDLRDRAASVYDDLVRHTWSSLTPAATPSLDRQTVEERRSLLRDGAYAVAGVGSDNDAAVTTPVETVSLSLDSAIKICRALWAIDLRPTGALADLVAHLYISAKMEGRVPTTFTAADWPLVVDACAVAFFGKGGEVEERHRRVFEMLVGDVAATGGSIASAPTLAWTAATLQKALGVEAAAPLLGRLADRPYAYVESDIASLSQAGGAVEDIAGLASPVLGDWTPPSSIHLSPPPYLSQLPADRRPQTPPGQVYDDELSLHILTTLPKHRDAVLDAVDKALAENRCPHPMALAKLIDALAADPARDARSLRRPQIEKLYVAAYDALALFTEAGGENGGQGQLAAWAELENSMLMAMAHLGDLEHVAMHRDRLIEAGCTPSADAYAAMILNMRDTTDDATVAVETFREARRLGVQPNAFLYNTLISRLSRARRAGDALAYFDEMRRAGVEPTAVTYGSMVNACCKTGDEPRARQLFDEMTAAPRYVPRHPPYNTMIQFFQAKGDRKSALDYFDRMLKAKVPLTDHTYRLLIDVYGAIQPVDPASAFDVFRLLERDPQVAVQGMHWAALVTMYGVHLGKADKAISLFDAIATHDSTPRPPTRQPDPLVYEALFTALWACGRGEDVTRYREQMIRDGAKMTAYTANALIKGYGQVGDIVSARSVFESLEDPQTGVAGHAAHHHHGRGHPEPTRSRMLPTDHVYREPSTYEALIVAEKRAGEHGRAQALFERAVRRAFPFAVLERMRKALEA